VALCSCIRRRWKQSYILQINIYHHSDQ
jgi:hypothetical protein